MQWFCSPLAASQRTYLHLNHLFFPFPYLAMHQFFSDFLLQKGLLFEHQIIPKDESECWSVLEAIFDVF